MIPIKLKLSNFLSHKDTEVDFQNLNAVCLYGENGAGKTSLLDGILYALYSYTSRGRDDSLIKLGEKKMKVEMLFEINNQVYKVVKEKEIGKSKTANLYRIFNQEETLLVTGERVDEYIEMLLGMNYDTFTSTFFLLQDNAYKFILATPTERYRILFDILGLEIYQEYRKIASMSKRDAETKLNHLIQQKNDKTKIVENKEKLIQDLDVTKQEISKVTTIKTKIEDQYIKAEKELSSLTTKIKELRKNIKTDIEKEIKICLKKISEYEGLLKRKPEVEKAEKERARLNQELASLYKIEQKTLKDYDDAKTKYNEILEKENKQKIELEQLESRIRERQVKIEQEKKTLKNYEKVAGLLKEVPCGGAGKYASCKLIANAVESKDKIPEVLNKIKQYEDEIKKLEKEKEILNKSLTQTTKEKEQAVQHGKSVSQKLKEHQANKEIITKKLEEIEKLTELSRQIAVAEKSLEVEREKLSQLNQELEKQKQVKEEEEKLMKLQNELYIKATKFKKEYEEIKQKESDLIRQKASLESQIELCKKAEQELKELDQEINKAKRQIYIYSILDEAYEKIPKIMFASYIATLENKVNEILSKLSNSGMQVELVTEKQTKTTKTIKNTLDIVVSDIAGERRIESYSGGEKTRLTLAFTVALSELASQKAGQRIQTLAIDEPPGLDLQGYKDFAQAVNQLIREGIFAKCFVISHSGELIEEFEQKIKVEKRNNHSVISIVTI